MSSSRQKRYFFCGIGGSGMLPLAMILRGLGAEVTGSDRSRDQGRTAEKFEWLASKGVTLFPQDGSGPDGADQVLVASAAIEDTVPDVAAALSNGAIRQSRAQVLSSLFNDAPLSIGVAGTSGKSTVTGMVGWILQHAGKAPTIMNGAVMKNFVSEDNPFASASVGDGDVFISEVDESDGSIANYNPSIAVLNNVAEDHKSMDELRVLFGGFIGRANHAVLNADDAETMALAAQAKAAITYSLGANEADLVATDIVPGPLSISCMISHRGSDETETLNLQTPGRHNVSNAMAAIGAAMACGVGLKEAIAGLESFSGIRRRFDIVGTKGGVTVIDDFGHNPDKISATLKTLHDFPGRLIVMFQPHGFGPLRKMQDGFIEAFSDNLMQGDVLLMPEPVYFGGTVDRSVSSGDIIAGIQANGKQAEALPDRKTCGARILELVEAGDRVIIMGARDDTLSEFARGLLSQMT